MTLAPRVAEVVWLEQCQSEDLALEQETVGAGRGQLDTRSAPLGPPENERVLIKVPDRADHGLLEHELLDLVLGTPRSREDWHQILKDSTIRPGDEVELRGKDGSANSYRVSELALARMRMAINQQFGDVEELLHNVDAIRSFLTEALRSNMLEDFDDAELEGAILKNRENEKRRDQVAAKASKRIDSTQDQFCELPCSSRMCAD